MAGDWLKFDKATPDKPEVFAIAADLNIDPDAVVGKLLRVWSWFDTHTEKGNASCVTSALLDRCAGVTGFVESMAKHGWMVVENGGCRLPNFDRHCGETAKSRAMGAKRSAAFKKSNATSVTSALPREEKRREENKEQEHLSPAGDAQQCPQAEIVSLYHELLPANPRMKVWDGERAKALRTRWREDPKRQNLDYWRAFFGHVAKSPFLTGQVAGQGGRAFLPGLDWLLKPANFAKVIEDRYHEKSA